MKRSLLVLVASTALASPALAQTKALPPGEIRANGDITFGNALKLGKREGNKTVITPDTLQILGSGSTGDASDLSARLRGSTKALALGQDTSIGHSVARFGTPNVETCSGNDAVDDSVAINAAITYVASLGGGKVTFPQSADCRVANPVILRDKVQLWGHGGVGPDGGGQTSKISPSVSMDAVVTQPGTPVLLSAAGIFNLTLDGRRPGSPNAPSGRTISVGRLLDVTPIGIRIEHSGFFYSSGDGVYLRNIPESFAWINWVTNNQFSQNLGWALRMESTDSIVAMNYIGVNGVKGVAGGGKTATENGSGGCIFTQNYGNIRFFGNQIEVCNTGVLEKSVDSGIEASYGNNWTGNFFDLNNTAFEFRRGLLKAEQNIRYNGLFTGNRFGGSVDNDILIDDRLVDVAIENSLFGPMGAGKYNVRFKGPNAYGWSFSGRFISPTAQRFQNAPQDTVVRVSGNEAQNKLDRLTVGPDVNGAGVFGINAGPGNVPTLEWRAQGETKYRQRINPADGSLLLSNVQFNADAFRVIFDGTTQFIKPAMPPYVPSGALPQCDTGHIGAQITVADNSGIPARGGPPSSGGATAWPFFCNGASWSAL
ncbi:hypothetical protein H0176_23440 [Methylorubrum populi]|uniref:hypothetical protein n=1 Tax=Methylorubrum rhodesianum TaxID=29427 RepID=UPI00190C39B0|nr:hypothetical protein [Methylorubrum rhodesianum]MBK3406308.1 hypothetical protein [Methylorubrum rhodesianum]MBY0143198.1 hypothetical protein [Methylorubrum populi]